MRYCMFEEWVLSHHSGHQYNAFPACDQGFYVSLESREYLLANTCPSSVLFQIFASTRCLIPVVFHYQFSDSSSFPGVVFDSNLFPVLVFRFLFFSSIRSLIPVIVALAAAYWSQSWGIGRLRAEQSRFS